MQLLFQIDLSGETPEAALKSFWETRDIAPENSRFTDLLVRGCYKRRKEIDGLLKKYSEHWKLSRMSTVDRNILRLAVFELLYQEETPPKVVINEALEVAKRFSTPESVSFLNGILDAIKKEIELHKGKGKGKDIA